MADTDTRTLHRIDRWLRRWVGVALTLVGVIATINLAITGRLTLYIHPRYVTFTVTAAVLAGLLTIVFIVCRADPANTGSQDHDSHVDGADHLHDHGVAPDEAGTSARVPWRKSVAVLLRLAVVLCAVVALLILPPTTLSSSFGMQRGLARPTGDHAATSVTIQGDSASYSIKDWWTLLQAGDPALVRDKPVRVIGQVVDEGSPDQFYVARQMITCCAVDAQLIGLPVSAPNWRTQWQPGQWVEVTGAFVDASSAAGAAPAPNPGSTSTRVQFVIAPSEVTSTDEPREPYVY